jgi:sugar lactone lactonase YvrE
MIRKTVVKVILVMIFVIVLLVGCSSDSDLPTSRSTPELTATPVPVPTTTPVPGPTVAAAQLEVVKAFDYARGQLPEGIAIDADDNIYVSVGYPFWFAEDEGFGEIWQIDPDGNISVLASFPGGPSASGLVISPFLNLYYAYPNPMDPETNGVYQLDVGKNEPQRLPGSENIGLANCLVINPANMYVSDSALGAIWRIPRGGTAELWLQEELLAGCDPETSPIGANGVALWGSSLYVANTSRGLLAQVPILGDGTAGDLEIVVGDSDCDPENDALYGIDGIAISDNGIVFAPLVMQHKLVRIDLQDGSYSVVLTDEDGLYNPASIVFGSHGDERSIYMTNFALLPPEPDGSLGPGVLKYDVGELLRP